MSVFVLVTSVTFVVTRRGIEEDVEMIDLIGTIIFLGIFYYLPKCLVSETVVRKKIKKAPKGYYFLEFDGVWIK